MSAVASPMRRERVAEQLHHELSDILQNEVNDPRKGWLTVVRVEMSPDLGYAKAFVSIYGDDRVKRETLHVLEHAGRFIRTEIGRRIRLRQTPEIHFELDESIEHSQRIHDILKQTPIPPAEEDPPA
jgi:ribosome-binding factor A